MIAGIIGVLLLLTGYTTLLFTKKYFFIINFVGSICLTIHAMNIRDYIFVGVNGFISLVVGVELIKCMKKKRKYTL